MRGKFLLAISSRIRIRFIAGLLVGFFLAVQEADAITNGTQTSPQTPSLQPGEYTWQPQVSPTGPVVIVADLSAQMLQVYRNGEIIGRSTIGAGKGKHPTPTGIFTILQKNQTHHSTKYHEASMPYMERLTWDGVAIHGGNVLGTPDSHGCIHVPLKFAKNLYDLTTEGATVLVTSGVTESAPPAKPDLEFSNGKSSPVITPSAKMADSWHPEASPMGPICIVFSSSDRRIYVYRNKVEIGVSNIGLGGVSVPNVGDRVYSAQTAASTDNLPTWKLLGSVDSSPAADAGQILQHAGVPPDFLGNLTRVITQYKPLFSTPTISDGTGS